MSQSSPLISICVPQYERTAHFTQALKTLAAQRFQDFEVVVSDGGSRDGGANRIRHELERLGLRHLFAPSSERLRYDANLRRAIALSTGRWCLLMGNDDGLADPDALGAIAKAVEQHAPVATAITNYREVSSGKIYRRAVTTGVVDAGVEGAVRHYRSFAFVSGVILDGPAARAIESSIVDGSEMYQMYVAAALLAAGGRHLQIDRICVDKDLVVAGHEVDSFRVQARADADAFVARPLPLAHLARTVLAGISRGAGDAAAKRVAFRVAAQLYLFTYPFWSVEWRRVLPAAHARRLYAKLAPKQVLDGLGIDGTRRQFLSVAHALMGFIGTRIPVVWFDAATPWLYALAKRSRGAAASELKRV